MNWYAFTDTEEIVFIGRFESFSEAAEHEPMNTHWIFNETGLRTLKESIERELK